MESGTLFILSQFGHVIACDYLAGPAPNEARRSNASLYLKSQRMRMTSKTNEWAIAGIEAALKFQGKRH